MALRTAKLGGLTTLSVLIVLGLTSPLYAQRGASIAGMTDFSGEWIDNSFEGDDRGGPPTAGPSREVVKRCVNRYIVAHSSASFYSWQRQVDQFLH